MTWTSNMRFLMLHLELENIHEINIFSCITLSLQ